MPKRDTYARFPDREADEWYEEKRQRLRKQHKEKYKVLRSEKIEARRVFGEGI